MLPERKADTMSEAIAIASPSGRMSKRAKAAADKRLSQALFGPVCTRDMICGINHKPASRAARKRREAQQARQLASWGQSPRKLARFAEQCDAEAVALEVDERFALVMIETLPDSRVRNHYVCPHTYRTQDEACRHMEAEHADIAARAVWQAREVTPELDADAWRSFEAC